MAIEILEFFSIFTKDRYGALAFPLVLTAALFCTLATRRPVSKIQYKMPGRDFCYEVCIGDLLEMSGDIVISTNNTFDTDITNGLIAPNSLQGQFLLRHFQGNFAELDRQIEVSLSSTSWPTYVDTERKGKQIVYPIGAVARVWANGKNFYLLAMAELDKNGTAQSSPQIIDDALAGLWHYVSSRGELGDLVMPVLGTGRGRVNIPRKRMIERIAQSFAVASSERLFARKLMIVIHPSDAENFSVNLFEIKDYLTHSIHG